LGRSELKKNIVGGPEKIMPPKNPGGGSLGKKEDEGNGEAREVGVAVMWFG